LVHCSLPGRTARNYLVTFKGVAGMMTRRHAQGFSLVFEPEGETA
jgi:hypothetical protein